MIPLIKNTARTTLSAGTGAGAGTVQVVDASVFPAVSETALSGTVTAAGYTVTGTATAFTTKLQRFDPVWAVVNGQVEVRYVIYIESDTVLFIDRPFSAAIAAPTPLTKGNVLFLTLVEGLSFQEQITCTNISGNTLTVYRAQDGSSTSAFSAGAVIEGRVTKALIETAVSRAVWDVFALMQESALSAVIGVDVPGLVADDIAEALSELHTLITNHLNDTVDAHDAGAISFSNGGWAATDVHAAILEAYDDAITALNNHAAANPAHAAARITFSPYGPLSSKNVQAALEELADLASTSGVEKIKDAVVSSGLTWDANDDFLLSKAIGRYVTFADFYVDSGAADSKVLTPLTGFRMPPSGYTNGMRVRFKVNATNTAATTINVGGLGLKNIVRRDGSALKRWDLIAGDEVELTFDEALNAFVVPGVHAGQILHASFASGSTSSSSGTLAVSHTMQYPGATVLVSAVANAKITTGTDNFVDVEFTLGFGGEVTTDIFGQGGGSSMTGWYFLPLQAENTAASGSQTVTATLKNSSTFGLQADSFTLHVQFLEVRP